MDLKIEAATFFSEKRGWAKVVAQMHLEGKLRPYN